MFCEKCGKEISDDSKFCPGCGQLINIHNGRNRMSSEDVKYITITSDKKKIIAIILCLLGFIGFGGLHRFYVGKIFSGFIYLCTAGILGMGTIIDLIQLLLGQFTDNVGQPLRR